MRNTFSLLIQSLIFLSKNTENKTFYLSNFFINFFFLYYIDQNIKFFICQIILKRRLHLLDWRGFFCLLCVPWTGIFLALSNCPWYVSRFKCKFIHLCLMKGSDFCWNQSTNAYWQLSKKNTEIKLPILFGLEHVFNHFPYVRKTFFL